MQQHSTVLSSTSAKNPPPPAAATMTTGNCAVVVGKAAVDMLVAAEGVSDGEATVSVKDVSDPVEDIDVSTASVVVVEGESCCVKSPVADTSDWPLDGFAVFETCIIDKYMDEGAVKVVVESAMLLVKGDNCVAGLFVESCCGALDRLTVVDVPVDVVASIDGATADGCKNETSI